jgi:putative ABC transport system permease protein
VVSVAVTAALLIATVPLLAGYTRLAGTDPGFRGQGVLTVRIELPGARYDLPEQQADFFGELVANLEAHEEVIAAGGVTNLPLSGTAMVFEVSPETGADAAERAPVKTGYRAATPGYFRTMGIATLEGREFSARTDRGDGPAVAVVNQTLAKRLWPGRSPVGQRVVSIYDGTPREVVGVVGDVRHVGLDQPAEPEIYVPLAQNPWSFLTLVVRGRDDAEALLPVVRGSLHRLDPRQVPSQVLALDEILSESIAAPRYRSITVLLFAILGLVSSALGIAGLVGFTVSQRVREIGVRLSLGAARRGIVGLFLREALVLSVLGVLAGAVSAAGLVSVLRGRLADLPEVGPPCTMRFTASGPCGPRFRHRTTSNPRFPDANPPMWSDRFASRETIWRKTALCRTWIAGICCVPSVPAPMARP